MRESLSIAAGAIAGKLLIPRSRDAAGKTGCIRPMIAFLPYGPGWSSRRHPLKEHWRELMPRLNSKCCFRELLVCAVVCLVSGGCASNAAAQAARPASKDHAGKTAHP